ncbi:hypothetical protein GOODEAATRI_000251 [Goodea atripinnis]|uniref:Uncharacterized protein n=1 Tax=Goodea atripinnis TaxID=208336 RepID=A0ABV0PJJ2_9TELE
MTDRRLRLNPYHLLVDSRIQQVTGLIPNLMFGLGGLSVDRLGHDEWGYVDCGGVVGLALEPVEKYCNHQSMTAVIA